MEKTAILMGCRNDGYKEDERIIACLNSMVDTFDEVFYFVIGIHLKKRGSFTLEIKRDQLP